MALVVEKYVFRSQNLRQIVAFDGQKICLRLSNSQSKYLPKKMAFRFRTQIISDLVFFLCDPSLVFRRRNGFEMAAFGS